MEDLLGGGAPPEQPQAEEPASRPEMMAELQQQDGLEEKRSAWIKKMSEQGSPASQGTEPSPQGSEPPESLKSGSKSDRGYQPDSMTLDDNTAKEIASHTLMNMLKKLLVSALYFI
jgi:hypothetical protein